jgi:hypothetical protein
MRYPLPGRDSEILEMGRLNLRAAIGLLTGHTTLYKFGLTERQERELCGYAKEDGVHILCHCSVLACKRYRIWDSMFLRPKDLGKLRVGSQLSLVANTGLGLVP